MRVEHFLKLILVFITLDPLDDFTTFKQQQRRHCCDAILNGKFHVIAHVDFTYCRFTVVVFRQLVNDWTQSLARWSAIGPKINKYRLT